MTGRSVHLNGLPAEPAKALPPARADPAAVTEFEIEQVTNGVYHYPLMKMQELVAFGRLRAQYRQLDGRQ